jgi:hypothetical protein
VGQHGVSVSELFLIGTGRRHSDFDPANANLHFS